MSELQDKIDGLAAIGGVIHLKAGYYQHIGPLDLRNRPARPRKPIQIIGEGMGVTRLVFQGECPEGLVLLQGMQYPVFRDLNIEHKIPEGQWPPCALRLDRNETGADAGWGAYERVTILSWYTDASVVNTGSEMNEWRSCILRNSAPNGGCYRTARGNSTNTGHTFTNCTMGYYDDAPNGYIMKIEKGTQQVYVNGGCYSMKEGGRAAFIIGGESGYTVRRVSLCDIECETAAADCCILIDGQVESMNVCGGLLQAQHEGLRIEGPIHHLNFLPGRIDAGLSAEEWHTGGTGCSGIVSISDCVTDSTFLLDAKSSFPLRRDYGGNRPTHSVVIQAVGDVVRSKAHTIRPEDICDGRAT